MILTEAKVQQYIETEKRIEQRAREVAASLNYRGAEWLHVLIYEDYIHLSETGGDSHDRHGTYEQRVGVLPIYCLWDDGWAERYAEEKRQRERQCKMEQIQRLQRELGQ